VDPGFSREKPVSVFSGELNGRRFDSRFFSGHLVEHRGAHACAFRPSQIHAHQHGSPVLRFRPAGAGLDGHDGIKVVFFPGEQRPGFQLRNVVLRRGKFLVELFQQVVLLLRVGFFLREMDIRLDVAGERRQLVVCADLLLGTLPVAENALRCFLIVPEIGFGDARFESFQALAVLRRVKDSSARA